jgi:hypothetical protein
VPSLDRLEADAGLALVLDADGQARVAWSEVDWLGPVGFGGCAPGLPDGPLSRATPPRSFEGEDALGRCRGLEFEWTGLALPLRTTVRAYRERSVLVFRVEATAELRGLATGAFDRPAVAWPWLRPEARAEGGAPSGARAFGYQYTEFALPTASDASLAGFFLLPFRPAVVEPLLLQAPDGRTLLLAPLDAFHEQVIAVPRDAARAGVGVRCGWHGDLDTAPSGFASELAIWAGPGPRAALDAWGRWLQTRHGTRRPGRSADALGARLSYWTDNGAAYWYRSEPGLDVPGTLVAVAHSLREQGIPFHAFQLDSWFYPHEKTRSFDDEGDRTVPPTGLLTWEPRPDLLPDGLPALRRALGDPPLVAHCRHFSSASPYFEGFAAWRDGDRAHPRDDALYRRLLHQAAGWGVETFEHDWLIECFLGVRGLREAPGRARAWQEALDRAAAEQGLTLQWCMPSPADFFQTVTLDRVTSIRTSGDYRYVIGNASLWAWFLYTNALARALGLHPFKDVFLSSREGAGLDGDPHAEAEALLAALSAGPVGLGDRAGRSDRDLVLRTCRPDGVLVRPDVPIAALDRCFAAHAVLDPVPLVGEAHSRHPAGRWHYLVALHAWRGERPLRDRIALSDLGALRPEAPVIAYDWRGGGAMRLEPDAGIDLELAPLAWDYRVLCPVLPGEIAVFGDPTRYATAGDQRIAGIHARDDGVGFDVLGVADEVVPLAGWSARRPAEVRLWTPDGARAIACSWDPPSGRWDSQVPLGRRGWARVTLAWP